MAICLLHTPLLPHHCSHIIAPTSLLHTPLLPHHCSHIIAPTPSAKNNAPMRSTLNSLIDLRFICYMSLPWSVLTICWCLALSPGVAAEPAQSIFKDGESQIVARFKDPAYWIRHDLWVETEFDSDGDGMLDRMHVGITRPRQTDTESLKVPVIYMSSPYFAGTSGADRSHFWNPKHELGEAPPKRTKPPIVKVTGERPVISKALVNVWLPRGFAVVHSSSPGTGRSQGCPTVGGDNESLAPKAVIEWLSGDAKGFTTPTGAETIDAYWSTGRVGMTGTSYDGTLALAAATTGVEGLKAIIPVAPNTSYYHYYRSNGLVRSPGGFVGEDIDVLYDFINSGDPARRGFCNCGVRDKDMAQGMDRVTGDYNEFWAGRDYLNDLAPVRAAVLMSHGFNDWNVMPEHSNRIYQALKKQGVPTQLYYHQGGHGGPPPDKLMNRWFTRYLFEHENNVENDSQVWIVREKDDPKKPTPYAAYPHPAAQPIRFHLTPGAPRSGSLTTTPPTEPQGRETVIDNYSFKGEALAAADWTNHRLLYVTRELTEPLHISGTCRLDVTVSCNKPAANLSVWLVSLPWNEKGRPKITDNIITRGWADPQNAQSLTESAPLEPGKDYHLSFDLQPDDQVIPKGQKVGLMIFCSDQDFTLRPNPGTELTLRLDSTFLTVPIVGGQGACEKNGLLEPPG
jgi:X-Pro dipeptidyl-peptidase